MDEKILFIINEISTNTYLKLDSRSFQEYKPQLNELIAKDLIKSNANGYSFTDTGYQIKEIGGYENYLNKLKQDKELQEKVNIAIIESAKAAADSAKSNQDTSDRLTEKYNRAKQSIDSLSRIQTQIQLRTTSLENSLKVLKMKP
jgi:hypothetical protein